MKYKDYYIECNPKPIPTRAHDWEFWHMEYDGDDDNRCGTGSSKEDCMKQIDRILEEGE